MSGGAMGKRGARYWRIIVILLAAVAASIGLQHRIVPAGAISLNAPTPGPGAMSIYAVTNPNTTTLNLQHVISDASGFAYTFTSQIPAGATVEYHVRDIPQVPSPFQGSVTLYGDQPFTAQIVGYDYPGPTITATATRISTPTVTATPTKIATLATSPTPSTSPSTPRLVQSTHSFTGSTVSRQTASFTKPVSTGDLVVVAVSSWNTANSATVSSVSDNLGNTYTKAIEDP